MPVTASLSSSLTYFLQLILLILDFYLLKVFRSRYNFFKDRYYRLLSTFTGQPILIHDYTKELVLRSRKNASAPVARLPVEILSLVFTFVQGNNRGDIKGWYWGAITHVCGHWRDIALQSQQLWVYIDTSKLASLDQTEAYLKRSGTSQLVVRHHDLHSGATSLSYQVLELALAHLYRIRELHICIRDGTKLSTTLTYAIRNNAAPFLQKFELICKDKAFDYSVLFNGQSPRLRNVELCLDTSGSSLAKASIMRNLRELRIKDFSSLTVRELFQLLAHNPNLEVLEILLPTRATDPDNFEQKLTPIRMHCLHTFTFAVRSCSKISAISRNLIMPRITKFLIYCSEIGFYDSLSISVDNGTIDPKTLGISVLNIGRRNSVLFGCRKVQDRILQRMIKIEKGSGVEIGRAHV